MKRIRLTQMSYRGVSMDENVSTRTKLRLKFHRIWRSVRFMSHEHVNCGDERNVRAQRKGFAFQV